MKLSITGGGRCNITNAEENRRLFLQHFGKAAKFVFSSFSQFDNQKTLAFFAYRGLLTKVEAGQRAFPVTERASDVVGILQQYLQQGNVEVRKNVTVRSIAGGNGEVRGVVVGKDTLVAQSYVVATGGQSHPETGSTGDGFRWLKDLGHTVKAPTPSVVPLAVADTWVKALSGVTLDDVKISFAVAGKKQFSLKGRILCTHFGLSGRSS